MIKTLKMSSRVATLTIAECKPDHSLLSVLLTSQTHNANLLICQASQMQHESVAHRFDVATKKHKKRGILHVHSRAIILKSAHTRRGWRSSFHLLFPFRDDELET